MLDQPRTRCSAGDEEIERCERIERVAGAKEEHDRGEKLASIEKRIVAYSIYAASCPARRMRRT